MASATFTFSCPHCQTRLTVPASLAGVSGPCPSCRVPITAPKPEPAAEPAAGGPRIRPEPRHLPERQPSAAIHTRRSTEDRRTRNKETAVSESGRRPWRVIHLVFPATFLAMAATIVGTLVYFFGHGAPAQRIKDASRPLEIQPATKIEPPSRLPAAEKVADAGPAATEAADGDSADPGPAESRGDSPAVVATAMLESFLQARDAASRVDMVEPATSEQELAGTLLKGPLPAVAQIFSDLPQYHPAERMTDFPYRVSFVVKDAPNVDFAILVRQRVGQPPRIFLPAFLDLVGGRLTEFTGKPNRLPPAMFHVYLEPIDGCYENGVPGADRKFTFKLLSSPFGKESARAYVSNASRFRKLVEEPTFPIRWGMRRRATVTLQWNHQEDPARPFLELVDLNAPDWNP